MECVRVPDPIPGPGEVVVRMRAASLNYRDTIVATSPDRFTPGRVPLSDGAGEVVEIGQGVTAWKVGDRVASTFFQGWEAGRFSMCYHQKALGGSIDGVLREYAVFPESGLVPIPSHFSFEQASTLPCAGLTAWYALIERGRLVPGQQVLVLGTGGVSIWALQIAHASGCSVIVTSSRSEKLGRARELGAWATINHRETTDWSKEVLRLTGGEGVDHVVEVGGPGTLGQSLSCVAPGGHVALIGVLTGFGPPACSLFPVLSKNIELHGIYVGDRESFLRFVRFVDVSHVQPVLDREFDFDEARQAYRLLHSGEHFGKIVVRIPS
jgi:NADPH:quinone reductase-like Zn-dependent oxidoreductase